MSKIICQKEVELLDGRYVVYLKKVPTQIASSGAALRTAVRAYVKKNRPIASRAS